MTKNDPWLLPDGIEEVLPEKARRLESMRRSILDLFDVWGYELVMPPLAEFLDSLLTGVGEDMDLQTFKLTDQISGRMMGLRPDITPQAARIDAHYLKKESPVRLCYAGPVLRTRPDKFAGSREPFQLGAELFGHDGMASELELLELMVTMLGQIGIDQVHVELGHVGIFRSLAAEAKLNPEQESALFSALQRKAEPDMNKMLASWDLSEKLKKSLSLMVELSGDEQVLEIARKAFGNNKEIVSCLDNVQSVYNVFKNNSGKDVPVLFDLAELSGYGYYTGIVYSAFIPGHGRAIAKGGRYDGIGQAFGRDRPATGFSADMRELINLVPENGEKKSAILAPENDDKTLKNKINTLRGNGERIVMQLPGHKFTTGEMGCDRELVQKNGKWIVK
ncbi:MAG: ATP phosphoribosyltransferase regulatory subunit [Acidiferrobacterales bacterium]